MSLGSALSRLLLGAWRPSLARPPHTPGLPRPPERRPAKGWPYTPSRFTTCSFGRVQVAESGQARSAPRSSSRDGRGSLRPQSSRRISFASQASSGPRRSLGQAVRHLPRPEKCTSPQVPLPQPRPGFAREMQKENKPEQGRPGPASLVKSPAEMRPRQEQGPGPGRCGRPPAAVRPLPVRRPPPSPCPRRRCRMK